ncbi:MAG: CheR family methyltransferase [Mariprofundaceae bacterium]
MSVARIISLLQEAIGLDESTMGCDAIRHAIRRRMQTSAVTDKKSFLDLLQASQTEMAALIEEIVVPETWFFRHQEAFRLMQSHLSGEWRRSHPDRIPRLLSVPCSSGEEAYSMAMALLDGGFATGEFHIDAVDISDQNLNKAKRAMYGKISFRGDQLDFRQRYFRQANTGHALRTSVRHAVNFHQGNILDHDQMQQLGTYDVIYCRNLLIYFDQESRKRTANLLAGMLRKDGLLFVGHAETGQMWKELFTSVAHPMAFAYRHVDRSKMVVRAAQPKKQNPVPGRITRKPIALAMKRAGAQRPVRPLASAPLASTPVREDSEILNGEAPSLEEASRLADQGRLEEARQQCEGYLQAQGASAQAWFLLGLISDIQDHKGQAKDAFRKALYLQPDHDEALLHLALLQDQLGDHRAARHLRHRIQTLSKGQQARAGKS